jgi:hypothetical protein
MTLFIPLAITLFLTGLVVLVILQTTPRRQPTQPSQASIPEYAVSITPQEAKQEEESIKREDASAQPIAPAFVTLSNAIGVKSNEFVPVRDMVIPHQASHGNKFNDVLGGDSAGLFQNLPAEVVVPSDYYHWPYLPTEFDGPYWPDGNTRPDYIYPGGPRPLRRQDLPAAYSLGRGA